MALRLLSFALKTNIRRFQQYAPAHVRCLNTTFGVKHDFVNFRCEPNQNRWLHVRVSDQEAGLQAKREANRNTNPFHLHDESPNENDKGVTGRADKVEPTKKKRQSILVIPIPLGALGGPTQQSLPVTLKKRNL